MEIYFDSGPACVPGQGINPTMGMSTPGRRLEKQYIAEEQVQFNWYPIQLILLILIQRPGLWHTLSITLGTNSLNFLSIKLSRQPIKLLSKNIQKISEPLEATLSWKGFLWHNLVYGHLSTGAHLYARNRKIVLSTTNPTVPGIFCPMEG